MTQVWEMNATELREAFGSKSSGRIKLARLFEGLILEVHQGIQAGSLPALEGNLRTFWYRYAKPVLARIEDDERLKSDPYDLMLAAFVRLVMEDRRVDYADFDFTDENWAHRFLGSTRPDVLVFAEKRGWIRFLRRLHDELGVSVLALGGAPSALTSEYTAKALAEQLDLTTQPVTLLAIVDWDPSGAMIAQAFARHLQVFDVQLERLELLVHPRHVPARELELNRVELPKGQPTKTRRWFEETGGVQGELFGLESEALSWTQLRELVEREL